ncbi:MAG: penicillin-binding protein, partial [Actinobacteria bacterium]|nr:penicillin-binding protein [Actinomycetota bacterium]
IGVQGSRITIPPVVQAALVAAGAPKQAVAAALAGAKAHPTWFEPVFTVPRSRYQQLQPSVYPVPGTVFQNVGAREPATPGLSYLVGTVGSATSEDLQALGAPYSAASVVGKTGLENADEKQLAGQPGATITAVDAGGTAVTKVAAVRPVAGSPVQTSIDPRVQQAAEQALAGMHKEAALVAVNAATGQLLAVANNTAGQFDLALSGSYPPGSAFKVLTTTALLEHGLTPSSPATCPAQVTIEGAAFHNAEGTRPVSDLLHAFAESCNTAFIGLATTRLSAADLSAVASLYRLGVTPRIGLPAFAGSVPAPRSAADLAATAVGQGRVLVSPLDMAMVAAAVDTGQVRAARLVAGAADDRVAPVSLPAAVVTGLHTLMAQVVAAGTAAGTGLPPGTYAKTGTAEYGHGNPVPTDAWLMGFNNEVVAGTDLAFAMITVNGGEGGPTDGPVVAKFLNLLRQSGA